MRYRALPIEKLKDFRLTSDTGTEWVFEATSQQSPEAPILSQTFHVILPPQAINAHLQSRGTVSQQLVYQIPENSGLNSVLFWAGIAAIGGGIPLAILGFVFCRRPPPLPPARYLKPRKKSIYFCFELLCAATNEILT
jgi:hypothetical protein